jgi:hypothetical protein
MSKHNRTSRRRRIALGLGATGGGLLAAAFMPVGIALADTTSDAVTAAATGVVGTDPGLFPIDNEVVPDPFSDLAGAGANATTAALDTQFNDLNPIYAAQFDYEIDNNLPFTFDGISGTVPTGYTVPAGGDPFEDVLGSNANALQYDYALNTLAGGSADATTLDNVFDGTAVVPGTPPEPTTPDPFLDALNATTATPTAAELAAANQADFALTLQNATYAGQLDKAVEAAIANHTLSATSTGGGTGDSDAASDAFTNAGATDALNPGAGFDSALGPVANQLDPIVDTLGTPATLDLDPAADWVQIFDPNAFTAAGVPSDFLGQLAVLDDTFLQSIGLAAPLDQFVDLFTGSATTTGTDALTGILGMFGL